VIDPQQLYLKGLELFNQEQFYDCHDTLEELWLEDSSSTDRIFYQGLIQTAVAFYHLIDGKPGAARAMLVRAMEKLAAYPERHRGIELESLRLQLREWKQLLDGCIRERAPVPPKPFPRIEYNAELDRD
jgi:predicted metal-dependent hydrolase